MNTVKCIYKISTMKMLCKCSSVSTAVWVSLFFRSDISSAYLIHKLQPFSSSQLLHWTQLQHHHYSSQTCVCKSHPSLFWRVLPCDDMILPWCIRVYFLFLSSFIPLFSLFP